MNMPSTKNGKLLLRHGLILTAQKRAAGAAGRKFAMKLFNKKETLIFNTVQQRDAYIERLEAAHVDYEVLESRDNIYSLDVDYILRVAASDLKKVS